MAQRLAKATPVRDKILGDPAITIDVENNGVLALCVFVSADVDEDLPLFVNLECDRRGNGSGSHVRLACGIEACLPDFYHVVCRTADRIQLDQMRVDDAIRAAVGELEKMLLAADLMGIDKQIGLWGELRVLASIAERRSWNTAVGAWAHGRAANEEHDFVLPDVDIEVKTTQSERRIHAIGPRQLIPSPGKRLLVCSVQITRAAEGEGESLAAIVERINSGLSGHVKPKFERGLIHAGWSAQRSQGYAVLRWRLRSVPITISADLLPRLAPTGRNRERIVDFAFDVNVEGLESHQEEDWTWT